MVSRCVHPLQQKGTPKPAFSPSNQVIHFGSDAQGATAGYPNTPTTATTASGGYPSSGITGGYPGTASSGAATTTGGSSSGYSTLGGSSSPLDTALQGAAGARCLLSS